MAYQMIKATTIDLIAESQPAGVFDEPQMSITTVYAEIRSATRSEFYTAKNEGLNPEYIFVLKNCRDYNGQLELLYENKRYKVLRAYIINDGIELTVERSDAP